MTPEEEKSIGDAVDNYMRESKIVRGLLDGDKIAYCRVCCLQGPKAKNHEEALSKFLEERSSGSGPLSRNHERNQTKDVNRRLQTRGRRCDEPGKLDWILYDRRKESRRCSI